METQNNKNIDQYFRKLVEEQEPKSFPNMDSVWDKIEEKLDKKPKRRVIPFWKYVGVAAALLLLITLGSRFINNNPTVENKEPNTIDIVVIDEEKIKEELKIESETDLVVTETKEQVKKDKIVDTQTLVKKEKPTVDDFAAEEVVSPEIPAENKLKISQTESLAVTPVQAEEAKVNIAADEIIFKEDLSKETFINNLISGTVVSADDGLGLPGVNVAVKETTRGTQTDFDGKYTLKAEKGETLVFSYLGMISQEIKVRNSKEINVSLKSDVLLDVVAVQGYRVTSEPLPNVAAVTVTAKEIEGKSNATFLQSLQGQVPGLKISTGSGAPGNGKAVIGADVVMRIVPSEEKTPYDKYFQEHYYNNDSESYEGFIENQFESAQSNPVSTFSIDVDNASYTNIRRFINNGQTVPKDAVRIEEMINFFKYDYPKPTGQHPFSIHTEYSDAPWNPNHKLVRIALQGKEIPTDKLPKSNFVFLVDVSGSMNSANKLPLLKASMKVLLDELRNEDRVSIVYYASGVGVLLEPTKATEKSKIIEAIDNMRAGGGTSGAAGLELAYQMAEKHFVKGGNNRIILATDGDFNIGKSSDKDMQELIEEKRKSGVFLTCLGFGMGNYKDSKMTTLSKKGNGNYAYIDNIQEANRFLGKEFKGSMYAIAKDVKIQIEFNPAHVQAYRLIGYEMRKLRNEDFTNDAIDAGELGSGHTVTALYEVIPNGVKSEFYTYQNDLKYTQNTTLGQYQNELATVKFRYKKPDGDKSTEMVHTIPNQKTALQNASKDFKFATSVAWFGLKLRDSKLIPNKDSNEIIKLAKEGLQNDTDGYKAEFIRLVESVK